MLYFFYCSNHTLYEILEIKQFVKTGRVKYFEKKISRSVLQGRRILKM